MASITEQHRQRGRGGWIGLIFFTLFLLFFLGMGLTFSGLIVVELYGAAKQYTWDQVECRITESRVTEPEDYRNSSKPYQFQVEYTYSFGGNTYQDARR